MQQAKDLVFPGLLDLSSLPKIPKGREKDLRALAETKAETKMLQSGKRPLSTQQSVGNASKEQERDDHNSKVLISVLVK